MRFSGVVLVVVLIFLILRFYTFFDSLPRYKDGQVVSLHGSVASIPDRSGKVQRFSFATPYGARLFVTTTFRNEYFYGQEVSLRGIVKEVVLGNKKTILTASFPNIVTIKRRGAKGMLVDRFYMFSDQLRGKLIEFYEGNLSRNGAALVSGVVLGVDNGISKDYKDSLTSLGVIHVVAASGMNVSIVAGVFFTLFSAFFHRKWAVIFSIVAIAFYTVLAGGQASIIRAAIMGSIAFGAGFFGRQYYGLLALFVTAIVMLFISPQYASDVGFQLSFFSTLGLLIIPRFLESLVPKRFSRLGELRLIKLLKEDFLLTLSAQIMTLPILFYTFGSYNLLSIPVNLLILWVIPPIMIVGGIGAISSLLVPFVGKMLILLTIPFLYYFEWIVRNFSVLHTSLHIKISGVFAVLYYLVLLIVILMNFSKKEDV